MNMLRNFRIGTRLSLGFAALLAMLVATSVLGIARLSGLQDNLVNIARVSNGQVHEANEMLMGIMQSRIAATDLITATGAASRASAVARLASSRKQYDDGEARLSASLKDAGSAREMEIMAAIISQKAATRPLTTKMFDAVQAGRLEDAQLMQAEEVAPAQQKWIAVVQSMAQYQDKETAGATEQAEASYLTTRNLLAGACVLAIVLGALTAWLLTASITQPLNEALRVAQTVARGDLSLRVEAHGKDEPAKLLHALGHMTESLAAVVSQVRAGSESIAAGSGQIASGNEDLSQRTEEQAANLQQTAASMEQLAGTVRSTADTARQATQLAAGASSAAEEGGRMVGDVVTTMDGIRDSSRKVSDIIGVIDGIAFQTNILALNAAVEAARAGEQGRGFAVVAAEVRSLAGRSADAAREIKSLIGDSVGKAEAGSKLVGDAGRTMTDIVSQVRRVSQMIGEISSAANEQTQGISQVGEAVTQLDHVTQQNAALVEQLAAAAGSLKSRSAELVGSVASFTLAPT